MRQSPRARPKAPSPAVEAPPNAHRDRVAVVVALLTVACVAVALVFAPGRKVLMPGPLTSAHSAIEACQTCHTRSGEGKLSWLAGLVAGDPHGDSKACLGCHQMPETAFNAHGASPQALAGSTERLAKIAHGAEMPRSARAQGTAFPTGKMMAQGLACTTCHQEHQGTKANLKTLSGEQCRSCHVLKFDSFDGRHPDFENYPFTRRTRLVYDHAGHFGKHFPETATKNPNAVPATCATCHTGRTDRRIMDVAPFEQTCRSCHLDQITGKDKVSGPKGIAFLGLPGLDLQTLRKRKAAIGEWPEASEARLTPFMKLMISRSERGRDLLATIERLDLQDLARASDAQVKAVTRLVWEIKGVFHALIAGKASDVLAWPGDDRTGAANASAIADLTASIPRDAIVAAQQQWLPGLGAEMARLTAATGQDQEFGTTPGPPLPPSRGPAGSDPRPPARQAGSTQTGRDAASGNGAAGNGDKEASPSGTTRSRSTSATGGNDATAEAAAPVAKLSPKVCVVSVFGQCLVEKAETSAATGSKRETPRGNVDPAPASPNGVGSSPPARLSPPYRAGLSDAVKLSQAEGAARKSDASGPKIGEGTRSSPSRGPDQSDDLLFPTEEEQRAMKGRTVQKDRPDPAAGKSSAPTAKTGTSAEGTSVGPGIESRAGSGLPTPTGAGGVIESSVDAESWAEHGGWYRQDHTIYYRPAGHKDRFIHAWLLLSGAQAVTSSPGRAAAVFDVLTAKDAPGACTKCHSVDVGPDGRRKVNFAPATVAGKNGTFTRFIHEPHFSLMESGGCLACHRLDKAKPYLKSYEGGDPHVFASNFGDVDKQLCQTCHTRNMARQDCLTCHKYHVNGVAKPIMSPKIPAE